VGLVGDNAQVAIYAIRAPAHVMLKVPARSLCALLQNVGGQESFGWGIALKVRNAPFKPLSHCFALRGGEHVGGGVRRERWNVGPFVREVLSKVEVSRCHFEKLGEYARRGIVLVVRWHLEV